MLHGQSQYVPLAEVGSLNGTSKLIAQQRREARLLTVQSHCEVIARRATSSGRELHSDFPNESPQCYAAGQAWSPMSLPNRSKERHVGGRVRAHLTPVILFREVEAGCVVIRRLAPAERRRGGASGMQVPAPAA